MGLFTPILLISSWICLTYCEQYELEFLNSDVYSPCEGYPDNSIHSLFDMSNMSMEQTEDGSIVAKGHVVLKQSVNSQVPLSIEIFRKERGVWQPTLFTQKRPDTCTACFGKTELWNSYLKNTPEDQLTCPFQEGQRIDFDVNEPTYMNIPTRNGEGEYKIHIEMGDDTNDGEIFVCVDVYAMIHKV